MACALSLGRKEPCKDVVGGITAVYFVNFGEYGTATVDGTSDMVDDFSDTAFIAYKYEVKDAIPYNAAIMASQGVTVAINSDDAEMSRRLNQEAAKTVKYGGVSEIEAWKTVTLNPAKLLHIDHKVGSISVGKEADIVLWTGHPMSIYSKAEKTLIQGAEYFDLEKDKALREAMKTERMQLTKLMLEVKESGGEVITPVQTVKDRFTCDTL